MLAYWYVLVKVETGVAFFLISRSLHYFFSHGYTLPHHTNSRIWPKAGSRYYQCVCAYAAVAAIKKM